MLFRNAQTLSGHLKTRPAPRMGSKTGIICEAMRGHARYRHLRVDWVGERATESITLCGIKNEDSGSKSALCPSCARVRDALNVCGFGRRACERYLIRSGRSALPRWLRRWRCSRSARHLDMQDRSQLN